jgi:hypothetical protein
MWPSSSKKISGVAWALAEVVVSAVIAMTAKKRTSRQTLAYFFIGASPKGLVARHSNDAPLPELPH